MTVDRIGERLRYRRLPPKKTLRTSRQLIGSHRELPLSQAELRLTGVLDLFLAHHRKSLNIPLIACSTNRL